MRHEAVKLGKNTFLYGAGRMLNRFVNFLLLPVYTAYLTTADYGIISILGLISLIAVPLFSMGLGAAMGAVYFNEDGIEHREQTIWTTFGILLISAVTLSATGIAIAKTISVVTLQTAEYSYFVRITLVSALAGTLSIPFMLYLQFEEKAKLFVILTTLSTLISISIGIAMVVVLRRGVQGMVEATLLGQTINLALFIVPAMAKLKFRLHYSLGRELLGFGIPLIPSFGLLFVLQHSSKYVLRMFEGLDVVGVYEIGFTVGMIMNLLIAAFTTAWFPFFMSFIGKEEEARTIFGRVITYYVFGFGALTMLFFLLARPVIIIMTQPAFHEAYKVVGLSASAQFFIGMYSLLLPGIYFAKEAQYQSLIQLLPAIMAFVLNLCLIPIFGLQGAGVSLAVGALILPVTTHAWNLKRKHIYLKIDYQWKRVLQIGTVYFIVAVAMLWPRSLPLHAEIVVSAVAFVVLAIALYFHLNGNERMEVKEIPKHIGRFVSGKMVLEHNAHPN
jgi:O-antigen/teichoic acid export membrane protein